LTIIGSLLSCGWGFEIFTTEPQRHRKKNKNDLEILSASLCLCGESPFSLAKKAKAAILDRGLWLKLA
jgi:hypothetical protein